MKIAVGCAKVAFGLKEAIKEHLTDLGHEVMDFSPDFDADWYYPEPFHAGAIAIQKGEAERGIFFCGTGMGAAIVANKHAGIYASVVESVFAAQKCKAINNANVLCLGAFILGEPLAIAMTDAYLNAEYGKGPGLNMSILEASMDIIRGYEAENMR